MKQNAIIRLVDRPEYKESMAQGDGEPDLTRLYIHEA